MALLVAIYYQIKRKNEVQENHVKSLQKKYKYKL